MLRREKTKFLFLFFRGISLLTSAYFILFARLRNPHLKACTCARHGLRGSGVVSVLLEGLLKGT